MFVQRTLFAKHAVFVVHDQLGLFELFGQPALFGLFGMFVKLLNFCCLLFGGPCLQEEMDDL